MSRSFLLQVLDEGAQFLQATESGDVKRVGRRTICRHNNGNNGARGAPGIIRE